MRFVGCGAIRRGFGAVRYVYVYVHTCTHSNSSRKSTKKFSYMQIYEEKSAEFVDFATKLACFDWNVVPNYACSNGLTTNLWGTFLRYVWGTFWGALWGANGKT